MTVKIHRSALLFLCCLTLQVAAWLVPAVDLRLFYENAVVFTAVMHAADVLAVLVLIHMFLAKQRPVLVFQLSHTSVLFCKYLFFSLPS